MYICRGIKEVYIEVEGWVCKIYMEAIHGSSGG